MPGAYLLNAITAAAELTPSTEDAAYPVANLYGMQPANVFRGTSMNDLNVLVDFGVAVSCDTIALINHNLTVGATISLKAGATSVPSTVVASPAYRALDLWKAFAAVSAQYWLLTITDTNAVDIQIGQFILGTRVAFPRARRIGNYSPRVERFTISSETYAGVGYHYPVYRRLTFNPTFRVLQSELAIFRTLDAAVMGNVFPWLYIPDAAGADCHYVRKEYSLEPAEVDKSTEIVYDYQMALVEETRGLEVVA